MQVVCSVWVSAVDQNEARPFQAVGYVDRLFTENGSGEYIHDRDLSVL